MAEKKVLTQAELDALYEGSVDDIPDAPKFPTPKPGVYKLEIIGNERKEINDKPAHEIKYKVVEVLEEGETACEDAESCNPGDQFSQAYFMTTEGSAKTSMSILKELTAEVAERFGTGSLREACERSVGCVVTAIVSLRQNPKDKAKWYPNVTEWQLD